MLDLGPHAGFIVAAYAVTFVAVGVLTLITVANDRKQRRILIEMERKGIRRRSAAKAPAPRVKIRTTKPKDAKARAKRKPRS
jgi:heme exporter protein D